jgi:hypothetical protein
MLCTFIAAIFVSSHPPEIIRSLRATLPSVPPHSVFYIRARNDEALFYINDG